MAGVAGRVATPVAGHVATCVAGPLVQLFCWILSQNFSTIFLFVFLLGPGFFFSYSSLDSSVDSNSRLLTLDFRL